MSVKRYKEIWLKMPNMEASLPFMVMVMVLLAQVSNMVVSKAAMSKGMNKYVLVVYCNSLASLILFPCSYIFYRSDRPSIPKHMIYKVFFLAVIGFTTQIFGYIGIDYSSPALATAMLNLTPAFTFMLAIIFRMETLDWKKTSSQVKSLGALVSIMGAFIVTFYKGPPILVSSLKIPKADLHLALSSEMSWVIGGFFLAVEAFLESSWYITQTSILKKFPALLIVLFYHSCFKTFLAGSYALFAVKDQSAWRLSLDMGLVVVFYMALTAVFRLTLSSWCLKKAGPFYVSMFKPLGIIFAVGMDIVFLGDSLFLGSLIGGVIIVTGFYGVMWGKSKEGKKVERYVSSGEKASFLPNRI